MWCVLYYVCVIAIVHGLDDPIVDTNYGKIRGKWLWSRRNLPIGAFIGIPYAEPPVGDQRFEVTRSGFFKYYRRAYMVTILLRIFCKS